MAFEETKEQQQMYNYFRSCIYIFLIIEIVMNLPITADNRITQFILDLLGRFKIFSSVAGCKTIELVCICIVCIGTKAKKALKFNVKTMVIYPVLAGLTLVGLCFIFHGVPMGMEWMGFPANRIIYAFCSVAGTMLVHQGLDGIAKYYIRSVMTVSISRTNPLSSQRRKSRLLIRSTSPCSITISVGCTTGL